MTKQKHSNSYKMNTRKINIALSAGLTASAAAIDTASLPVIFNTVRQILQGLKKETGAYTGLRLLRERILGAQLKQRYYALEYGKCHVILKLTFNQASNRWSISHYELRDKQASAYRMTA